MRACNCARASPLQSRTRVGCDSMRNTFDIVSSQFQSTHPRGVRLNGKPSAREVKMVSIHAPAWGATVAGYVTKKITKKFQSTHPRGVRPESLAHDLPNKVVSIHAPAWGATSISAWMRAMSSCFNPRTRVGCDVHIGLDAGNELLFQSTHPRGVRRAAPMLTSCAVGVSIHAPAWGATPAHTVLIIGYEVSIHAPAWGATSARPRTRLLSKCFNPRTRVGCDLSCWIFCAITLPFQSTHPRGVRQ